MVYIKNSGWVVIFADHRAEKEIAELADDVRADFLRIVEMLETHGPEKVHAPYVKHLQGKLWEMRMRGKDGIARAVYLAVHGKRLAVLHAFVKKTQQTPREAIELALKRGKELGFL